MNMRQYHDRESRISAEASSKSIHLYNRRLAAAVGVPVPQGGTPSEIRDDLIDLIAILMERR